MGISLRCYHHEDAMQRLSRKEYPKESAELERLFRDMLDEWAKRSGGAGARVPQYLGVTREEPPPIRKRKAKAR